MSFFSNIYDSPTVLYSQHFLFDTQEALCFHQSLPVKAVMVAFPPLPGVQSVDLMLAVYPSLS